jgi:hypothetical protein
MISVRLNNSGEKWLNSKDRPKKPVQQKMTTAPCFMSNFTIDFDASRASTAYFIRQLYAKQNRPKNSFIIYFIKSKQHLMA